VIDSSLEAGDVVVAVAAATSEGMAFAKSTRPRQANAAGVISTTPGVARGAETASSRRCCAPVLMTSPSAADRACEVRSAFDLIHDIDKGTREPDLRCLLLRLKFC